MRRSRRRPGGDPQPAHRAGNPDALALGEATFTFVGVVANEHGTYDLVADWWGVETTNGTSEAEFKDLVNQKYQYHNVKMACEEKGYAFEEEVNEEDGSIRLVVRKWVAD